jgi:acetoin utilization deacetylase AcuC-like enzyme
VIAQGDRLAAMLPFKIVYDDRYNFEIGQHVFPSHKFRMVHEALVAEGFASLDDFLGPLPACDDDLLRVHTLEYFDKLKNDKLSATERLWLELPFSPQLVESFRLAAGGSILAGRCALEDGFGVNLGGGFHHAFPEHGEGFCMLNDVAVGIRRLQSDATATGSALRVMVVDTDVHQGNGTAAIFNGDASVFTMSIHQERNYPVPKQKSDLDINVEDAAGDEEYLELLVKGLAESFARFEPGLLFYVGGADPYRDDQLGGLWVTMAGLRQRDLLVFREARHRNVPVAVTLAGGYARKVSDTVRIHVQTVLAARDVAESAIR